MEVIDDDKLLKKLELSDLKKEQVCVQPGTDRWLTESVRLKLLNCSGEVFNDI